MTCRRCHQRLHTPLSLARGYGPVCWLAVGKQLSLFPEGAEPSAHSQEARAEQPLDGREAEVAGFDLLASGHGYRRADHLGGDDHGIPAEEIRPADGGAMEHARVSQSDRVPSAPHDGANPRLPSIQPEAALLGSEGGEAAVDQLAFGCAHASRIPRARGIVLSPKG